MHTDTLQHHGVQGQKWGVKNGPPYPLNSSVSDGNHLIKVRKTKEEHVRTKDGGHDSSNKRGEAVVWSTQIMLDIMNLDVLALGIDSIRVGKAVVSAYKDAKYKKERASRTDIDPETGFKKIPDDANLSEKEQVKRVNPNYGDFNSDSKNNCMLCTTTYEMRRRGYDVTAQRDGSGYLEEEVTRWFPKAKVETISPDTGSKLQDIQTKTFGSKAYGEKIVNELEKQPEGSRGNLMFRFPGGAHSVSYEIQNGKLVIRDCQTGKIYKDPMKLMAKTTGVSYARYDNVDFDPEKIKEVCYS